MYIVNWDIIYMNNFYFTVHYEASENEEGNGKIKIYLIFMESNFSDYESYCLNWFLFNKIFILLKYG